jgi:hypothetical protein
MKKRIFGMLLMGAMVVASMSMFTSCKDYDDDINNLQQQIDSRVLKADLESLRSSLSSDLSSAVANLNAAIAAKADASALDAKASADDVTALAARVAALEESIKAIDNVASQDDVTALATTLAALTGDVETLQKALEGKVGQAEVDAAVEAAIAAVNANLELQNKALEGYDQKIKDLEEKFAKIADYDDSGIKTSLENAQNDIKTLQGDVKALTSNLSSYAKASDVTALKNEVNKLSESISSKVAEVNVLNALVNKILTSITLIPQTYLNGIEAIQFVSVQYTPQRFLATINPAEYTDATNGATGAAIGSAAALRQAANYLTTAGTAPIFNANVNANPYARPLAVVDIPDHQLDAVRTATGAPVAPVTIDNGQTEAYYRVSPAAVKEDQIDTKGIKMVCTTANTQTRAPGLKDNDPVKATFKSLSNGVLTVTLNKTVSNLIRYNGEDTGKDDNIASLMVPRKKDDATKQEAAEIYSEFNLIDETIIEPRIAALNKYMQGNQVKREFNPAAARHVGNRPMQFHYIDSLHIFKSQVDCVDATSPAGYLYVKEGVQFDEQFDLLQLVTGCYETPGHNEITKDQLKKYGIAFRFAIPKTYASPEVINQNATNQQDFIKFVDADKHIIQSKLPQGRTDNRAAIGKEPIIRVMLIDTVRHNLIDQTYFKLKFVDNTPLLPEVPVEFTASDILNCNGNTMTIKWEQFIEKVYAEIGDNGLSWQQFQSYYPMAQVQRAYDPTSSTAAMKNPHLFDTNPFTLASGKSGIKDGAMGTTTNGEVRLFFLSSVANQQSPDADANELRWMVNGDDIKKILPNREKTIQTKVIFKSTDRTKYGDVAVTLKFTIKLPDTPELSYYQNYWYDEYNSHYVLPVQYNTKAYYDQLIGATANNSQYNPANIDAANAYVDEQGNAGAYCVYNNNLFNAFTFNQERTVNGVANKYYNTPIKTIKNYNCADWDYQFRLAQPDATVDAHPQYWTATATEPLITTGIAGTYTQTNFYTRPTPWVTNLNGAAFGGYNLETKIGANYRDAIWMNWYDDEKATNGNKEPGTQISADGSWAWNVTDGGSRPYLFADHFNQYNQILINPINSKGIGAAPEFTNNKKVRMGMFLAWNRWNVELIKSYTICLVAPLDINARLNGFFEEGLVSGSFVNCAGAFTMVDFRGYEVAANAHTAAWLNANTTSKNREFYLYPDKLYNYYECQDPVFDLTKVKYGMKRDASGNVVVDNTVTIDNISSKGLTSAQIEQYTNGNVVLSIEQFNPQGVADTQWLRFKNNGGSNVEAEVNVFIPATMNYGFGSVTKYVQLKLYPRGKAPARQK